MNMFFKKLFSLKSTSSLIYTSFFPPVFNVVNSVMKILAHASFLICLIGTFGYIPGSITVDSKPNLSKELSSHAVSTSSLFNSLQTNLY